MLRVIVTGASGFIGRHLTRELARCGADLVAVDRRGPVEIECDVLDAGWEEAILPGSTVVHLAGASGTRDATPAMCERDNVAATVRVAELAAERGARLILASSSSVYGGAPPNRESDTCTPVNHYGESKLQAERRALEITAGDALALRFFTVYGPGQRANMLFSRAILAANTGATLTVHDPEATRDFTYVDEVVRAIGLAVDTPSATGVMNIGAGESHSVAEALALIERIMGRAISVRRGEAGVAEPEQTRADVARAAEQLGFSNAISLEAGIQRQVAATLQPA